MPASSAVTCRRSSDKRRRRECRRDGAGKEAWAGLLPSVYQRQGVSDFGYMRLNTTHINAITTSTSALPSGPTEPPVSQREPWNDEFSRWPGTIVPLSGTEYRKLSPQSQDA